MELLQQFAAGDLDAFGSLSVAAVFG